MRNSDIAPVESENWNIGKGFSITAVLLPLTECRRLIKICLFGVEDISEDIFIPEHIKIENKIFALNRLLEELKQIIEDTTFVMDKHNLKNILLLYLRLQEVESKISAISYIIEDCRTHAKYSRLNEEHYTACLNELRNIFSEVKKPLNAKNLIFPSSGDFDLDKIKEDIIRMG